MKQLNKTFILALVINGLVSVSTYSMEPPKGVGLQVEVLPQPQAGGQPEFVGAQPEEEHKQERVDGDYGQDNLKLQLKGLDWAEELAAVEQCLKQLVSAPLPQCGRACLPLDYDLDNLKGLMVGEYENKINILFHEAIQAGNLNEVLKWIAEGADITSLNDNGLLPHASVIRGDSLECDKSEYRFYTGHDYIAILLVRMLVDIKAKFQEELCKSARSDEQELLILQNCTNFTELVSTIVRKYKDKEKLTEQEKMFSCLLVDDYRRAKKRTKKESPLHESLLAIPAIVEKYKDLEKDNLLFQKYQWFCGLLEKNKWIHLEDCEEPDRKLKIFAMRYLCNCLDVYKGKKTEFDVSLGTALFVKAIENVDAEMMSKLVENGVSLNIRWEDIRETAFDRLKKINPTKYKEMVTLLLKFGADPRVALNRMKENKKRCFLPRKLVALMQERADSLNKKDAQKKKDDGEQKDPE